MESLTLVRSSQLESSDEDIKKSGHEDAKSITTYPNFEQHVVQG